MTELEFGWIVGFWEGEGSCRARKDGGGIEVVIGQCSREPLDYLEKHFGGKVRECIERPKYNPRASRFWTWTVTGHAAREFLIAIEPYILAPSRRQRIQDTLAVPLVNRNWVRDPVKLAAIRESVKHMTRHGRFGTTVRRLAEQFGVSPKVIYNVREGYVEGETRSLKARG